MNSPFTFRDWVRGQRLTYSILAFKTPIDDVVTALQDIFQIQSHQPNLPLTGKLSNLQGVPAVKFKDFPWCVVYWSIGRGPCLETECRILSGKLSAQVINVFERDASGWVGWSLYQAGEDLEIAHGSKGNHVYFRSSLRKQMKLKRARLTRTQKAFHRALEELLSDQNIYIPELDIDLAAAGIERVDVLVLPDFLLGMKDFQNWMYQGQPDYAVFAVKAPIEQVGQMLVDRSHGKEWQKQVQSNQKIRAVFPNDTSDWIPMLQPTANQWTVVYWSCGKWVDTSNICRDCSSSLQTRVISLGEEDTSGAMGYEIYENGQDIERAEFCKELIFDSKMREEPEFCNFEEEEPDVMNQFFQETFIQEGIYLPNWWDMKVSDPGLECLAFVRLS